MFSLFFRLSQRKALILYRPLNLEILRELDQNNLNSRTLLALIRLNFNIQKQERSYYKASEAFRFIYF